MKHGKGMALENMIETANRAYAAHGVAWVHHTSPEITITGRKGMMITGRLGRKGAVDYWGILPGGRAIAFDAKEVKGTAFPLSRISDHQREDLRRVHEMGGTSGIILMWDRSDIFWMSWRTLDLYIQEANNGGRKSIPRADMRNEIQPKDYGVRCDYLPVCR